MTVALFLRERLLLNKINNRTVHTILEKKKPTPLRAFAKVKWGVNRVENSKWKTLRACAARNAVIKALARRQ